MGWNSRHFSAHLFSAAPLLPAALPPRARAHALRTRARTHATSLQHLLADHHHHDLPFAPRNSLRPGALHKRSQDISHALVSADAGSFRRVGFGPRVGLGAKPANRGVIVGVRIS